MHFFFLLFSCDVLVPLRFIPNEVEKEKQKFAQLKLMNKVQVFAFDFVSNVCYLFKWHSKQEVRTTKTLSCHLFAESARNVPVELTATSTIFLLFFSLCLSFYAKARRRVEKKINLKFDTFWNCSHISRMEIKEDFWFSFLFFTLYMLAIFFDWTFQAVWW